MTDAATSPSIRWAARTDVGRARDRNEDAYFGGEHVFAVADGLGGHNAGDVASHLAIESLRSLDARASSAASGSLAGALTKAVHDANRAVYERAQADAKVRGMGTTLTAVAIADGSIHLAHVGDSRCYLLRGGSISQLSRDHTLVARMVAEGKLTAEQAEAHPQRSILTRALGAEPEVDVDSLEIPFLPGDRLLLCSDGLSSVIDEERIRSVIADSKEPDETCRRLVDEANMRGGPDNITVLLIEMAGAPPSPPSAAPPLPMQAEAPARRPDRRRRPRVPGRVVVWALVLLLLGLGGWLGVRTWVNRSFFVGVADGNVAIYRGLPTEIGGVRLARVEERTGISIQSVPEWFRPNLAEGIRAKSLAEARAKVRDIPRNGTGPSRPDATQSPTPAKT